MQFSWAFGDKFYEYIVENSPGEVRVRTIRTMN
jgi:hypothetical protein